MKKRIISLVLALIMVLSMAACGAEPAAEPEEAPAAPAAEEAAPAEPAEEEAAAEPKEIIEVKYGLSQNEDHLGSKASQFFADYIMERDDSIQFTLYFNSQLGDESTMLQSLAAGSLDMMGVSFSTLSSTVPEMNIMSLPFFYGSAENFIKVTRDEAFFNEVAALLRPMGFEPVGVLGVFTRSLANTKHTVRTPEDVAGLKVRVMDNPLYIDVFNELGASPVTVPFPEVYTGLQQGLIEGEETGIETVISMSFYEVEKYYSDINYQYSGGFECVSAALWEKLSDEQRALFYEAAGAANDYFMELQAESLENDKQTAIDNGVEFTELTEEERDAFREKLQPVIEKYANVSDKSTELYNMACEILGY